MRSDAVALLLYGRDLFGIIRQEGNVKSILSTEDIFHIVSNISKGVTGMDGEFTKEHTFITKGVLVILLLIHHVFFEDNIALYHINTMISDPVLIGKIVSFGKICIAGFAFITAYGMTLTYKRTEDSDIRVLFSLSIRRLIKLVSGVAIVYVLAVFYKRFVMVESIRDLYISGSGSRETRKVILYMFLDMIGMANYTGIPTINVTWWYLSYSILLIITMPFLYFLYKKFRYALIPAACLLPTAVMTSKVSYSELFSIAVIGIAFAYEGWFVSEQDWRGRITKIIVCIAGLYLTFVLATDVGMAYGYMLSFFIPYTVFHVIGHIPVIRTILAFIGKNATNIFLTHTFVYYYFYTDFIYSFQDSWRILGILLGISLCISLVLELIKKLFGYNWLTGKILDHYDRFCIKKEKISKIPK